MKQNTTIIPQIKTLVSYVAQGFRGIMIVPKQHKETIC